MRNKIDSNDTGLRIAEEASLKTLPGSPVFYPQEPNSYSDFGGNVTTKPRNPINDSRQRRKGNIVDLDASGGFNSDLTQNNMQRLLQGFLFADARQKPSTAPLNGAAVVITGITAVDDTYAAASGLSVFRTGDLVLASGFSKAANNGLKTVVSADVDGVVVGDGLVDETPASTAKLEVVGYQFDAADVDIEMNGNLPQLVSNTEDFTTWPLVAGEWLYLGDDTAANRFANNAGFARIGRILADRLEFDKVNWTPQAEVGTGKTVCIYFGTVIRNEPAKADIKRRTYQLERTLGNDDDGVMSEYITGAVASELAVNVPQADYITMDLSFVGCDHEIRTGAQGVKAGTRPDVQDADAFNTSTDFSRIKMSAVDETNAAPTALFVLVQELSLSINNNVSPDKAVGYLGAADMGAGTFEVGGSVTAYFCDTQAVQAVRNNSDITLDMVVVRDNAGLLFDVPLLALGNGRLNVEANTAITLPLDTAAARSKFGTTLLFNAFPYLPTLAGT